VRVSIIFLGAVAYWILGLIWFLTVGLDVMIHYLLFASLLLVTTATIVWKDRDPEVQYVTLKRPIRVVPILVGLVALFIASVYYPFLTILYWSTCAILVIAYAYYVTMYPSAFEKVANSKAPKQG
jgi:hypothetical protein